MAPRFYCLGLLGLDGKGKVADATNFPPVNQMASQLEQ
jgi:hypothetical protein